MRIDVARAFVLLKVREPAPALHVGEEPASTRGDIGLPGSRSMASSGTQTPVACGIPLEHGRTQSEWLGRNTADPKPHAFDGDLNEGCVRSVRVTAEIDLVGFLPKPADLGRIVKHRGPADQHDERIFRVLLKDELDVAGTPDVGRLARPTIGNESDRPAVLGGVGQDTPHWSRVSAAGLAFSHQPAIAHACDNLSGAR